jgi:uncharacterized protein YhaN
MAEEQKDIVILHPIAIFLLAVAFVLMLAVILRDTEAIARLQALLKSPTESHVATTREGVFSRAPHHVRLPNDSETQDWTVSPPDVVMLSAAVRARCRASCQSSHADACQRRICRPDRRCGFICSESFSMEPRVDISEM